MGTFFGILAAITLAVLCGYFALLNQGPVEVNLGPFLPTQRALLHEIIGYSAITGTIVSFLALFVPLVKFARTARALRRQVRALEEQIKASRDDSASGSLFSESSSLLPSARVASVARADEEPV